MAQCYPRSPLYQQLHIHNTSSTTQQREGVYIVKRTHTNCSCSLKHTAHLSHYKTKHWNQVEWSGVEQKGVRRVQQINEFSRQNYGNSTSRFLEQQHRLMGTRSTPLLEALCVNQVKTSCLTGYEKGQFVLRALYPGQLLRMRSCIARELDRPD